MKRIFLKYRHYFSFIPLVLLSLGLLVWAPFFSDSLNLPKTFFLVGTAVLVLFIKTIELIGNKKTTLSLSPTALLLGAFTILCLFSLFAVSKNLVEATVSPYGVLTFLSLFIIVLGISTPLSAVQKNVVRITFYSVISLIALQAVGQSLGWFSRFSSVLPVFGEKTFSITANPFTLIAIFIIVVSTLLEEGIDAYKKNVSLHLSLTFIAGSIITVGLIVYGFITIPLVLASRFGILDSWHVMIASMVSPLQALLGVGSEQYIYAFTFNRPLRINATPLWSARVFQGGSLFFHLGTTLGMFAIVLLAFLLIRLVRLSRSPMQRITSLLCIGALLFIQPGVSLLLILVILLVLQETTKKDIVLSVSTRIPTVRYLVGIVIFVIGIGIYVLLGRVTLAEFDVYQAATAFSKNDTDTALMYVKRGILNNPYVSSYHLLESQIFMSRAVSIITAQKENPQETDSSTQNAIANITEAISDAQRATLLGPKNVLNWEQLAGLYGNLIGTADGADTFAITNYQKAIALDPNYPLLRQNYAIALAQSGQYDLSLSVILSAIDLQPGIPNFYVILGNLYEQRKEMDKAKAVYKEAISLLSPDSEDAKNLQQRIDRLSSQTQPTATPSETLQEQAHFPVVTPTPLQEATGSGRPTVPSSSPTQESPSPTPLSLTP